MTLNEPIQLDMGLREHFLRSSSAPGECYQCGTCTATCPLNLIKEEKFTVRKVLHKAQVGVQPNFLVWECTSCKLCEARCPRQVNIVESIRAIRNYQYKRRNMPKEFESLLWNVLEEANPAGEAKANRATWAKGLDIKPASNNTEYLLFVGGPASYDPRLQKVVKKFTQILNKSNINFGIIGKQEPSSGEAVREIGEISYLDYMLENNVKQLNEIGMPKIITISPHSYDIMKRVYPEYGLNAEVFHYTELLHDIWSKDLLKLESPVNTNVTYHDPCFLGRYNGVYDQPRDLIESIKGIEFNEMAENKSNSICCGGGGNQMYRDSQSETRLSDVRVVQATETGAQNLITSCGYCIQNFEDSTKTTGKSIIVNDLIELISMANGMR